MYKKYIFMINKNHDMFYAKEDADGYGKVVGYYMKPDPEQSSLTAEAYVTNGLVTLKPHLAVANEFGYTFEYTHSLYYEKAIDDVPKRILESVIKRDLGITSPLSEYILYKRSWEEYVPMPAAISSSYKGPEMMYLSIFASTIMSEIINLIGVVYHSDVGQVFSAAYIYDIHHGFAFDGTSKLDYYVGG